MPGHYCMIGSSNGTGCPPGTYLNETGGQSVGDCFPCIAGHYCSGYGNPTPTGFCDPGYYCPTGMETNQPAAYQCPVGKLYQ